MQIPIHVELIEIAKQILASQRSLAQWAQAESCDEFQTTSFCGGFDADEEAFCFSYFSGPDEFWFQLSLEQVQRIARGEEVQITGRRASG